MNKQATKMYIFYCSSNLAQDQLAGFNGLDGITVKTIGLPCSGKVDILHWYWLEVTCVWWLVRCRWQCYGWMLPMLGEAWQWLLYLESLALQGLSVMRRSCLRYWNLEKKNIFHVINESLSLFMMHWASYLVHLFFQKCCP